MKYLYLVIIISLLYAPSFAQSSAKTLKATKIDAHVKIDGVLDEDIWKTAPIATDFIELNPVAGRHEKPEERTEVRILYDNTAIYIGARMYETSAAKISKELTTRDQISNDDFIGIVLDTYLDGINASGFYVTAAGVQFDAKYAPSANGNNEDPSWNAVWESAVKIDNNGWTAEFKIPYSALRFPKKDIQTWGLNMIRKRQQEQKQLFWNELDPKKNGFINQEGQLTGIEKLTPPLRLAFYPYFSTYLNNYPYNTAGVKNTTGSINGGMDVKYGINQSFTLDMTLIPDFGQVQSDNQVLNLTPFRVKYDENRPFFTEGTELFNKGNLFYSRNIGGTPIGYNNVNLNPHEAIIKNPSETRLLNATKLSGRMANGLAIGVFNAITQSAQATVQDSISGNTRYVETAPTTNYSILVLDQNLKNNSAISLINTNVTRFGKNYNADVGGFVFNLNNKKNSYGITGYGFMSNLIYPDKKNISGYTYEVGGGKNLGNFTWNIYQDFASSNYNPNDLGIINNPNYFDHNINLQYFNYKPTKYFTQWGIYSSIYYSRRYQPWAYQALNGNIGTNFRFKNFWFYNFNIQLQAPGHDFYESYINNVSYNTPGSVGFNTSVNTNRAKRLSGGFFLLARTITNNHNAFGNYNEVFYSLRINDKLAFGQDVSYNPQHHFLGHYTNDGSGNSVFSLYNRNTIENIFNLKYTFNNTMGLTLRLRHYWSKRNNFTFYNLQADGSLVERSPAGYDAGTDVNFNTLNTDMIYTWVFSPGSLLSVAYKNSSLKDDNLAARDYLDNLTTTFKSSLNNNFSIKILYYLDYQNMRKKGKKVS